MNKPELIKRLSEQFKESDSEIVNAVGKSRAKTGEVLDAVITGIQTILLEGEIGESVPTAMGKFELVKVNPRTGVSHLAGAEGKEYTSTAKKKIAFRPSKNSKVEL